MAWPATDIPWPRLESGRLDLSDDTFREMARAYPAVAPLRELRAALSEMRLSDLAVGSDGRNRTMLSAFRARTGRNQPSNTKFIFGPSVWLRGLIQPPPGYGIAYIDWAAAGVRHRGGAVRRSLDDGGLPLGRSLSRIRQAGGRCAAGCDQGDAQGGPRPVQVDRAGRAIRHGRRGVGAAHRATADPRPRAAAPAPRNLSGVLALVRHALSTTRC